MLERLFRPRSAAIVGASTDPCKPGGMPVHYSKLRGYTGLLYPVNPGASEVQGLRAWPSVSAIGEPVDCAVIAVPAAQSIAAMQDVALARVPLAVVFSAGFAELSEEGRVLQEQMLRVAREGGVRVLGPNSMGAFDLASGFVATFSSSFEHHGGSGWPTKGPVSVASQSGAVGVDILVRLRERSIGLAKWVATGNQCDVDLADCIEFLAADADTRVLVVYVEGCRDGGRLAQALAAAAAADKPVLVLKAGTSEAGANAVASHTASLAASDELFGALLARHGAVRMRALNELIDLTAACSRAQRLAAPSIGLVSISGGVAALMADEAAGGGLEIPPMPAHGERRMRELVSFAATRNPIDAGAPAMADMALLARFVEIALEDGGYPALVCFLSHLGYVDRFFDELRSRLVRLRCRFPDRVIALAILAPRERSALLEQDGFLVFDDPARAVACVAALAHVSAARPHADRCLDDVPALAPYSGPPIAMATDEAAARAVLEIIGIPVVSARLVTSAAQAADEAARIGGAVALKVASPDLPHKTESGGVMLGVAAASAAQCFDALIARVRSAHPAANISGVLVSPMVTGGVETFIGVKVDPALGAFVAFGIGGVFVEVYRDLAWRPAPFGRSEALAMIREIRGFPLLDGARGRERADLGALAEALSRLSVFAARHAAELESIDINPFVVHARGALALDALIVPRAPD
ncbi:MAG: acetate--CoA ligase family protein [Betaproteobacteria bacterium]|nr:acetate--CoA ligase family protein [Betaproteobacteria bacterium]